MLERVVMAEVTAALVASTFRKLAMEDSDALDRVTPLSAEIHVVGEVPTTTPEATRGPRNWGKNQSTQFCVGRGMQNSRQCCVIFAVSITHTHQPASHLVLRGNLSVG